MSLKFIYGESGTGKTTQCVDMIKELRGSYDKVYFIVPESCSYAAETLIAKRFGAVCELSAEVVSFKRLYYNMLNLVGAPGHTKLDDSGKQLILSYICKTQIKQFKALSKSAAYNGFAEILNSLIREFKTYNITSGGIREAIENMEENDLLALKLEDLNRVFEKYSEYTKEKFTDAQDEMSILKSMILENREIFKDSLVVFDGFSTFPPQSLEVIEALMISCRDSAFAFTCDSLEISENPDVFAQQKRITEKIKNIAYNNNIPQSKNIYCAKAYKYKEAEDIYCLTKLAAGLEIKNKPDCKNIELSEFANQLEETEAAAEKIRNYVRNGGRYRDVLVIARDEGRYNPVIKRVFGEYEIPVFVSGKIKLLSQPAVYAIICALDIINENFNINSVITYIKSGFCGLSGNDADLLENYIIASGVRGSSWTNGKPWKYVPKMAFEENEEEFLNNINCLRGQLAKPVVNLKKAMLSGETVKEKCAALYEFICEIRLYESINAMMARFNETDPQTASYYGLVWNSVMETLDETAEVLGDKAVTVHEFSDIFETAVSSREISLIPTTVDSVTVSSGGEGQNAPIVFVLGTNEDVYPTVMGAEGLLDDSDRQRLKDMGLELAPGTTEKMFDEEYVLYCALGAARRQLYISWPIADISGGNRFAARIVKKISKTFGIKIKSCVIQNEMPGIEAVTAPHAALKRYARTILSEKEGCAQNEIWQSVGAWFKEHSGWKEKFALIETAAGYVPKSERIKDTGSVYGKNLTLSVSRLEQYGKCPFSYFAKYILRLQTRKKAELDVADAGSFMHEILEKLSEEILSEGQSWQTVSEDFLRTKTEKLVNIKCAEVLEAFDGGTKKQMWLLARLKNTLAESALQIANHLRAGKFVPIGYEIVFGENEKYTPMEINLDGRKIKLRGIVDRADVYESENGGKFLRIIDYKSGRRSFNISKMMYGLQLQLAVYLDRLCDIENAQPGGILYFRLHDPSIDAKISASAEEIEEKRREQYKMSGVVLADDEIVHAMDADAGTKSAVIPVAYTAGGDFNKRSSSVASAVQFKEMRRKLKSVVRRVGNEMTSGNIDILPYRIGDENGCAYCDYKDTCHFESGCGSRYNELPKMDDKAVWETLEKEETQNA